jgi:uncharacterized membrane protein YphA (DoxX/SURF4 family)
MISVEFRNRYVPLLLALLRIAAGWHFLYEGLIKVFDPSWTARWYLKVEVDFRGFLQVDCLRPITPFCC